MVAISILLSPIGFGVVLILLIVSLICFVALKIPLVFGFLKKVAVTFFFFIHTKKRTCRAVYALIGSQVGWYFNQSPLIDFVVLALESGYSFTKQLTSSKPKGFQACRALKAMYFSRASSIYGWRFLFVSLTLKLDVM
jgi:hypothetical protein